MTRSRLAVFAVIVFCIILGAVLISLRISSINSQVGMKARTFPVGEAVPLFSIPEKAADSETITFQSHPYSEATFTVLDSLLVADDSIEQYVPGYVDEFVDSGSASAAKTLIVTVQLNNPTDSTVASFLEFIHAREEAWSDGPDILMMMALDENTKSFELAPGETKTITLCFTAYDIQFGLNTQTWNTFGQRGLHLELEIYPYLSIIELDLHQGLDER